MNTFSLIPSTLQTLNQFINWNSGETQANGKPAKVPVSAITGKSINAQTPKNWREFQPVVRMAQQGKADGIGLVMTPDLGIAAIDIDGCRNPETGQLSAQAHEFIKRVPTYTEVSPSGTGIRAFVRATLPKDHKCRQGNVEVYVKAQFVSLTGNHLPNTPNDVCEGGDAFHTWFVQNLPKRRTSPLRSKAQGQTITSSINDDELVNKMRRGKNGALFIRLFDHGDTSGFESASDADLRLCGMLAFYTGKDADRMDGLFRRSALMRDKWERDDYREDTITTAIAGCTSEYDPQWKTERETPRNTGGASLAESEDAGTEGFAAPLSTMLHKLERDLRRMGVEHTGGYLTLPPHMDAEDARKIGVALKSGTDRITTLLRYLWARWYSQLPTRKGVKGKVLQALYPGADGLQALNEQKKLSEDAAVVRHVPVTAWDFTRPWDFYVHLARLHDLPERQTYWLEKKPYSGMYADMTADYAPKREQVHAQDTATTSPESAQTFDAPPHRVTPYTPNYPISNDVPDTVSIEISQGMADMLKLVADRAWQAGIMPEDYLRTLLASTEKRADTSEISEVSAETPQVIDRNRQAEHQPRDENEDAEPLPDIDRFAPLIEAARRDELPRHIQMPGEPDPIDLKIRVLNKLLVKHRNAVATNDYAAALAAVSGLQLCEDVYHQYQREQEEKEAHDSHENTQSNRSHQRDPHDPQTSTRLAAGSSSQHGLSASLPDHQPTAPGC